MPLRLPNESGSTSAFIDIFLDDAYGLADLPDNVVSVIDVGCHAGLFAACARLRWPDAIIHGYEPNPEMQPYWKHQSREFGFTVEPQAVGLTSGFIAMQSTEDSIHARACATLNGSIPQSAFADTLRQLGGQVDLVKLDCEGAEWEILKDQSSWARVRYLTMEFHLWAGYSLQDLKTLLETMNWQVRKCFYQGDDFGLLHASNLANSDTGQR